MYESFTKMKKKDIRKIASELIIQIYDIKQLREKHVGDATAELDNSLRRLERYAPSTNSDNTNLSDISNAGLSIRLTTIVRNSLQRNPCGGKSKGYSLRTMSRDKSSN